jgi:hypothetical protein
MMQRVWWVFVTVFFVAMNVVLWRSEFGPRHLLGSRVRTEVVWERLLKAADASDLEIRHRGVKIGRARWAPALVEPPQPATTAAALPEGMAAKVLGYQLDLDGNLVLKDPPRIRFSLRLSLDPDYTWTKLSVRVVVSLPDAPRWLELEADADAAQQTLRLRPPVFSTGDGQEEEVIPLAELQQPDRLLARLSGVPAAAALAGLGGSLKSLGSGPGALEWEAVKGYRLPLGRAWVPVYRLRMRLLNRDVLSLYVADSGEILRVELPNDITLVNEKFLVL